MIKKPLIIHRDLANVIPEQEPCKNIVDYIDRTEAINAIHTTMHKYFNTSDDPEPFNDKDKLLLNVNKAITNSIKELPSVTPSYNSIKTELKSCEDCISRAAVLSELNEAYDLIDAEHRIKELVSVTPTPKRRLRLFKIIDNNTGKEPTDEVITELAKLGNLMTDDIDGFYVGEDGQIILVDDCGNCTWLGMNRFRVESEE